MFKQEVKKHDRTQFEVKLHYDFARKKRKRTYSVEMLFFVPNVLGINKYSFHRKNFYDSIKNYIRFSVPEFSLTALIESEESPLNKLFNILKKRNELKEKKFFSEYEHQLKLFCTVFASTIKRKTAKIFFSKSKKGKLESKVVDLLAELERLIEKFRKVEKETKADEKLLEIFNFADEYVSLLSEKSLFQILEKYSRSGSENITVQEKIIALLKTEKRRREERNYRSVVKDNSSNEEMLFRFNALKKYFSSVLSLEYDVNREGRFLEHFLFGIAAGLAMLFATSVAFWGQSTFGNLTMPFFVILVVSYMFKDRIKEIMREILKRVVFKHLFDFKYKLYIDERHKVGNIRESFDFIKKESLSDEVLSLRKKFQTPVFDNKFHKENIILYRKKILLKSRYLKKHNSDNLKSLSDIFRFDVTRFLAKMDDPQKTLYVLTEDGFKKIKGKRVYHINLILKIVRKRKVFLSRYRLVLTKNGIDRIEQVS